MIVEILGLDGAGKTTLTKCLAANLDGTARKVRAYDPGFGQTLTMVRSHLGYRAELALRGCVVASALIRESANPPSALDIFDRYIEAARMFFSVMGLKPIAESVLTGLPQPDLVILLDVDVATGMARRHQSTFSERSEEISYMQKCASYLRSAATVKGWVIIDASADLETVVTRARTAVLEALGAR